MRAARDQVKIVDLSTDWKSEVRSQAITFAPNAEGVPASLQWSSDGQVRCLMRMSPEIFVLANLSFTHLPWI